MTVRMRSLYVLCTIFGFSIVAHAEIKPERDGINIADSSDCILFYTRPVLDDLSVEQTIEEATHIVLPCSPSPGDTNTIRASAAVVRQFRQPESKAVIVLNMVKANTILAEEAPDVLRNEIGLPVLRTAIPDRQCIQRAILGGWKALDAETQTEVFKLALEITT